MAENFFPPLKNCNDPWPPSAQHFIGALVVKCAAHRLQLLAEGARGLGRDPGVLVRQRVPAFDHREMILPVELDHIVEPAISLGTPALFDKAFYFGSARLHL